MTWGLHEVGTSSVTNHSYLTGKLESSINFETTHSFIASPMPLKKRLKKRPLESKAPLYTKDIGTEGIKKTPMAPTAERSSSKFGVPKTAEEELRRRKRMERFGINDKKGKSSQDLHEPDELNAALSACRYYKDVENLKSPTSVSSLVGTCTTLEKPYLRLTTFPKAENVRSLEVLVKALAHIKCQFIRTEDFEWANEQLKSVRQDITVQHIRNKFVLEVYETHARILLEHGDLDEFHQCQTMIQNLTSPSTDMEIDNIPESVGIHHSETGVSDGSPRLMQSEEAADEFQAYGILYNLVQNSWGEMTRVLKNCAADGGRLDGEIPACLRGSSVRHALKVVKAVMNDDYKSFFRLYESAPHLSAFLMDFLVRRVRKNAYERIVASYRPTLSIEHFRESLFFEDLEETRRFLRQNGASFVQEQGGPPFWVDCKATFLHISSTSD